MSLGKLKPVHLQRKAYVYVRQSSMTQMIEHAESKKRQYALVERAVALGWPREAVEVVDEDQGKSGASTEGRAGFSRLVDAVAHGEVGAILALEVSRLARSSVDWQRLLALCVETSCGKRGISIAASEFAHVVATPQVLVSSRRYLAGRSAVTQIVGPRFREIASTWAARQARGQAVQPPLGTPRPKLPSRRDGRGACITARARDKRWAGVQRRRRARSTCP